MCHDFSFVHTLALTCLMRAWLGLGRVKDGKRSMYLVVVALSAESHPADSNEGICSCHVHLARCLR